MLRPSAIALAQIAQIILRSPAQSGDPRFAQQNPRMVRIRTLRITYIRLYVDNVCVKPAGSFTALCVYIAGCKMERQYFVQCEVDLHSSVYTASLPRVYI